MQFEYSSLHIIVNSVILSHFLLPTFLAKWFAQAASVPNLLKYHFSFYNLPNTTGFVAGIALYLLYTKYEITIEHYPGLRKKSRWGMIYVWWHTFILLKLTFNVIFSWPWYSLNYRKKKIHTLIKKASIAPKGTVG